MSKAEVSLQLEKLIQLKQEDAMLKEYIDNFISFLSMD